MFDFWREATAASVPGFLRQSGRRRPENASILSSLVSQPRRGSVRSIASYFFSILYNNRLAFDLNNMTRLLRTLRSVSLLMGFDCIFLAKTPLYLFKIVLFYFLSFYLIQEAKAVGVEKGDIVRRISWWNVNFRYAGMVDWGIKPLTDHVAIMDRPEEVS